MKRLKLFSALAVGAAVMLIGAKVYAMDPQIEQYLTDGEWDLLGWRGEALYFKLQEMYAQGNPFKIIHYDIMNLKAQALMSLKCFNDNDLIYMAFSGSGFLIKIKKAAILLKLLH